jgi:hypothetical protein
LKFLFILAQTLDLSAQPLNVYLFILVLYLVRKGFTELQLPKEKIIISSTKRMSAWLMKRKGWRSKE